MEFDRLVVSFLVDEVVGGFFISVPPGHIACVYDRGSGVLPKVWGPGLHLKIPFWQIAKLFNAQILEYTIRKGFDININKESLGDEPIRTSTADGKDIVVEASILFRLDKHNAPELWENIGENFVSKLIRPIARSKIASAFSGYALADITANRTEIERVLKDELNRDFQNKGLLCEGFLLSEVKLAKESGETKSIFNFMKRQENQNQA
ncbi:MAG TPA: prohibitin family protein [Candidatus Saccharimonadia bacterium]|nr:prohibitin family protein [Candidatus Saccharimonadia bacterium]